MNFKMLKRLFETDYDVEQAEDGAVALVVAKDGGGGQRMRYDTWC